MVMPIWAMACALPLAAWQGAATLRVRPENLRLDAGPGNTDADMAVAAQVVLLEPLGSETLVRLQLGAGEVIARLGANFREPPGAPLTLHVAAHHLHLFDPKTGLSIA